MFLKNTEVHIQEERKRPPKKSQRDNKEEREGWGWTLGWGFELLSYNVWSQLFQGNCSLYFSGKHTRATDIWLDLQFFVLTHTGFGPPPEDCINSDGNYATSYHQTNFHHLCNEFHRWPRISKHTFNHLQIYSQWRASYLCTEKGRLKLKLSKLLYYLSLPIALTKDLHLFI